MTNGLRGRTNGLTNGTGFTNGLAGTRLPREVRAQKWKLYLIPILAVALLITPLLSPENLGAPPPISIDGYFTDWPATSLMEMAPNPQVDPNIDVVKLGMVDNGNSLAFYLEVAGLALSGGGTAPGTMDAVRIFVDADGSAATGHRVDGLGADRMIEVSGIAGGVRESWLWEFEGGRDSRDWGGWGRPTWASAASGGSRIEVAADWTSFGFDRAKVSAVVRTQSWQGEVDVGDAAVGLNRGTLLIVQQSQTSEILSGSNVPLLSVTVTAGRQAVTFESLTVRVLGTAPTGSASRMRLVDIAGREIGATVPVAREVRFSFNPETVPVGSTATYAVVADFAGGTGETFGVEIPAADAVGTADAVVSVREVPGARSVGYIGLVPAVPRVDGGFGEWTNTSLDPAGDPGTRGNANVDVRNYGAIANGPSLHLYADVAGRILAGTPVPEASQPAPATGMSGAGDSDRDTVPDGADPLPDDFDNDGLPDAQTNGDVDGDGLTDYGLVGGSDTWLNTTIPASFPALYAGKIVSVYIGPTNRPVVVGEDVMRVFLDVDNSTLSGFAIAGVGADRMVEIRGKGGDVTQSALLAFTGSSPGEWRWDLVSPVTVASGYHEIELAVGFSASAVVMEVGDFWGGRDSTAPVSGARSSALPRISGAPNPPRILDISGNARYWLRDTAHATETACTTNKVATTTQGAGAVKTVSITAGQDACWYLDATAGTTIPAGSWESLLDLSYTPAAVDHDFVEVTTEQTTTSSSYVDIPGASLPSTDFTAGRDYLLVSTAQVRSSSTTVTANIVTLHGTTAFVGAYQFFSTDVVADRHTYFWFTVWTAVSGEGVKMQFRSQTSGTTIGADQITIFKMDLGALTNNTDWYFRADTVGDTLTGSTWDTLTTLTFTPSAASDWLVMAIGRIDPDSVTIQYESRIQRTGEASSTEPSVSVEGNDATDERVIQTLARVYSLTAVSNTFNQQSRCSSACSAPRTSSFLFALNLDVFEDHTSAYTEAEITLSTTDFATEIQTASLTPTRAGDAWILGEAAFDVNTAGNYHKFRLQMDQVDQPGTQTSDAYQLWDAFDALDEIVSAIQTVENLAVSSHAFDLDASREGTTAVAEDRVLFAVAMTLAKPEYDVRIEIWNKATDSVSETIGTCLDLKTYGDDLQCLASGVAQKSLTSDQVVRLRVVHSSATGTVTIEYDDADATGDSRVTLPIPEFVTIAIPFGGILLLVAVARRWFPRRRGGLPPNRSDSEVHAGDAPLWPGTAGNRDPPRLNAPRRAGLIAVGHRSDAGPGKIRQESSNASAGERGTAEFEGLSVVPEGRLV